MNIFNLLFTYEGRINRGKFWLAVLAYIVISVVIVMLLFIPILGWIAAAAGYIGMLVSGVMVGIKRLHDRDKSGWWIALFVGVPMVLGAAGAWINYQLEEDVTSGSMVLSLVSFAISLWGFIELGCLRGTAGQNQYGPDPLNQAA
ncbi:MAG: DUF805 domain-containing protein [Alphaproteobacteria bacterium]|nr:DUF805 domain-containing protein [Alphaproteobacteria bacterium]